MSWKIDYVLDSTAVVALLYSEPGHQHVKDLLIGHQFRESCGNSK